jgi:hypothetical protein
MVVFAAHFVCVPFLKSKRDPVLLVHADAVSTLLVALERLEAVARRHAQIVQCRGGIDKIELPLQEAHDIVGMQRELAERRLGRAKSRRTRQDRADKS